MGRILYAPGIEVVSGAMSKINRKSNHAWDQNMFLATHREKPTMNPRCSRAYFRKINNLPTGLSQTADARAARNIFGTKATAISQRRQNLATLTQDQAKFIELNAGYKLKTGYSGTFTAFLWAGADHYWNEPNVDWPQSGPIELTQEQFNTYMDVARSKASR